jgi:nicotinamide-nucleotide amidase
VISASATRALAELIRRGETLATAESLTGGLLGRLLTDVPGASAAYLGGVISYATRLKVTLAGVDANDLATDGPVAARTAAAMASGVAVACAADWGLATTGVAGPDAQDGHPVGQVFVAVANAAGTSTRVVELALSGGREEIRQQAADAAMDLLVAQLVTVDGGAQATVEP